jgi:hypothetical protein
MILFAAHPTILPQESYGKVQELYFEALFQHGTLKTHELFARISDSQHDLDTLAPDNSFLKQALSQLAAERLVETVPSMLNAFGETVFIFYYDGYNFVIVEVSRQC